MKAEQNISDREEGTGENKEKKRCGWCDVNSPEYVEYHDSQWGVPVHDDGLLFEILCLECMQAGLSWLTILKKRENFRKAFDGFNIQCVSAYTPEKIEQLLADKGIVRNRQKIFALVRNAQVFLEIGEEFGSFDAYLWGYVKGKPLHNHVPTSVDLPAKTPLSEKISKDLRKRGMRFVGPVIVYSFMQAV